jgi:hypothetical protein
VWAAAVLVAIAGVASKLYGAIISIAWARLGRPIHPWGFTVSALATACNAPSCTRQPPPQVFEVALSPSSATPPANPLSGTPCETLANAGPPHPRGPLPDDPKLAAFTTQVESVADEYLALEALNVGQIEESGWHGPDEPTRACARVLWDPLREKLLHFSAWGPRFTDLHDRRSAPDTRGRR